MVSFTKLQSGEWGIRGDASEIRDGGTIAVSKKDGSKSTVTVSRIVWTDGRITIAAIGKSNSSSQSRPASGSKYYSGGYEANKGRKCCRCGDAMDCGGNVCLDCRAGASY